MTEYNDGFDRGYAHGYESGYAHGRHDQLLELSEQILLKMCRCGHENADHKQMIDEGRPTYKFVPEQIAIITDGVQKLCDSYEAEIQSLEARAESLEAQLAQAEDTVAQMRFENWEEII